MQWIQRESDVPKAAIAPPVDMPHALWAICCQRGYKTKEELQQLFQPQLKNLAHPFALDEMDRAVERTIAAFKNKEPIGLYADYDLDGSPGLALIQDGLQRLGFQSLYAIQPSRVKDGYGFHPHLVDKLAEQGAKLIITVDVGITDVETVNYAKSKGIDVIITDHHLPKLELPKATAILNPNKGTCSSKLEHLCGAGVAFYFLLALKMEMEQKKLLQSEPHLKELLDLFALATITDMVPLVKENRVLVKHGLVQLAHTERKGLKILLQELGFAGKKIRSQDVAFRIAPKLNALTRLDEGVRAFEVLTADEKSAARLVEETLLINRRRVMLQEKAQALVSQLLADRDTSKFLFLCSHEFHPGVISLLASDLMGRFGVPAFVGSVGENGQVIASARSPSESINLQEVLGAVEKNLVRFGGHAVAAGFEFKSGVESSIQSGLDEYFSATELQNAKSSENVRQGQSYFDAELEMADLTPSFVRWLEALGPFGVQFEAPRFLLKQAKVKKCQKLKGNFLKYHLEKDGQSIEAPWFKGNREYAVGTQVDILFEPQINDFRGGNTVQALIHDMR